MHAAQVERMICYCRPSPIWETNEDGLSLLASDPLVHTSFVPLSLAIAR
jgi:hypothetical protein